MATSSVAVASATAQAIPSDTAAEAAKVTALERAYWSAEQHDDHAMMDSLLAPDYRFLSSRGGTDRSRHDELKLLVWLRVARTEYVIGSETPPASPAGK